MTQQADAVVIAEETHEETGVTRESIENSHKTIFSPDLTPNLIIEVRRVLGAVM
ncbi:hypothetical protein HALLA_00925 (plasmid) [Halostagnicola larsenii XH-48]|uniref:Uncharacterized protein n=1 Tax=Halostagnicola larsenii XH-48 TaxID=797299 RepID=W0JY10_9EURY|nr:hypothetical protein [Halostagnicola larsenii]AHG01888.1 hypothetical protein HALLA_00925 [Halostagnicola larsenii XH-48]